jgi:hypothetical protein
MGLINNTTPAFEGDEGTHADKVFASAPQADPAEQAAAREAAAQTTPEPQPATQAPAAPATGLAVNRMGSGALAIAPEAYAIMEGSKDALPVDFNTFPQITTTNGNFVERESKAVLGDTILFELLSHQDSWVVDPGDDKAPKELVRYSVDGVVCSDGTPVQEHLHFLKAGGYADASVKQRSVVVGEVISCSKTKRYDGELVQFDLSPMSRVQWQRYLANSVNTLRKGRKTVEQLKMITATTELATKGDNTYTKAMFAVTEAAAS